ncbi:MAG: TetR/AcrR family transcriptional regulator [Panacagrimonas sp.]
MSSPSAKSVQEKARRTQQQRKDEARTNILRAGFTSFGRYGYRETSLNRIAEIAGCSKELPRYHFGSKEALVSELFLIAIENWKDLFRIPSEADIVKGIAVQKILKAVETRLQEDTAIIRGELVLIFAAADPSDRLLKGLVVRTQAALLKEFGQLVFDSAPVGRFARRDCDQLTKLIVASVRGIALQWMLDPKSADIRGMFRHLHSMLATAMNNSGGASG